MGAGRLNPFFDETTGTPGGDGGEEDGSDDPGQEPGTQEPPAGDDDSPGGNGDDQMVPAKEAREARQEAKNLRERAKKAEEELKALKAKDLTAQEKAEQERDEARETVKSLTAENQYLRIQVLLPEVGITDPDAVKLLDISSIDDPTDTKQLRRALKKLVDEKPYLAETTRRGGADGGEGGGRSVGGSMNDLIRQASGRGRA